MLSGRYVSNQFWIALLFVLSSCQIGVSQKIIQLEFRNRVKSDKIHIGETFYYQLQSLKGVWIEGTVKDILVEKDAIEFHDRLVILDQIRAIRFDMPKSDFVSSKLPAALIGFSYTWTFWATVAWIAGETITTGVLLVPVIAYTTGKLLKALFGKRTYRLGKRKSLRLLDLNFYPVINRT